MSSEGGDDWAFSEGKDWKDGRHARTNEFVREHAGEILERDAHDLLTAMEGVYERAYRRGWLDGDDWPEDVQGLETYRTIRSKADTDTFRERVEQGDEGGLRSHIGSQSDGVDVSGWRDVEQIREIATERHLRLYEFGEPGTGKTRSGCLVARHWLEERFDEGHDDAVVLTNIRSLAGEHEAIKWVSSWDDLQEMIDSEMDDVLGEDVRPFLFLFDEASSQASGSGSDGYQAKQKLATLVYKIRKFGGALVIIGHDGKDVHPAVRLLCKVLHKTSKKKARFYDTVKSREGRDPITPAIEGWPDSMWKPNDKDPAPWSWSINDEEDMDEIPPREWAIYHAIRARQAGVSVSDTADTVGYSDGWVSTRMGNFEDGKEEYEIVNRVAEKIE